MWKAVKICNKTYPGNAEIEAERLKQEARNWEMEPGNWKMEPGNRKMEAGRRHTDIGRRKVATQCLVSGADPPSIRRPPCKIPGSPGRPLSQIYPLRAEGSRACWMMKLVFWMCLSECVFWMCLSECVCLKLVCLCSVCLRSNPCYRSGGWLRVSGSRALGWTSVFRCLFHIAFLKVFSSFLPPFWITFWRFFHTFSISFWSSFLE